MGWLLIVGWWINRNIHTRNSAAPSSDYDSRVVKAVSTIKTRRNHWAGDTSLVGAGVGSDPTRYQNFLITFELALDLGELDSSSIFIN